MKKSTGFNNVVISVGTSGQKRIAESVLPYYEKRYNTAFSVIVDGDAGKRIGSGGALLKALNHYSSIEDIDRQKNLVILTGGISKRVPGFSVRGKAFVPLGLSDDGREICVLDLILENANALARRMDAGVLVCCGDIILDTCAFTDTLRETTAFCVQADISVGKRHGVMFADQQGHLKDYLQKASENVLSQYASRNGKADNVPVDAGWIYLSVSYVQLLYHIAAQLLDGIASAGCELNLFTDILPVNAANRNEKTFLQGNTGDFRCVLWKALCEQPLKVFCFDQPFLHFGTPGEILKNRRVFSHLSVQCINCDISPETEMSEDCLLDNVQLSGKTYVGEGCLITDIEFEDVQIPAHTCLFGVRMTDGRYVACVQPIEGDPSVAGATALGVWESPLFYPASSFTESYLLYQRQAAEEKCSLAEILPHADAQFYLDWRKYLADLRQTAAVVSPAYETCRRKILENHFAALKSPQKLNCVKDCVRIELPVRINFSGTWTDCMPYCIDHGGEVINAAVKVNGSYPICITAERIDARRIEMCNADSSRAVEIYAPEGYGSALSECNLHRAVFRTLGIDNYVVADCGLRLTVGVSGVMKGSGLGTSSILLYGCFLTLRELCGLPLSDGDLLQYVFIAEQLMHTGGGWQDQSAVIGTGFKTVSAAPGVPQKINVEPLPCSEAFRRQLNKRLVLVSTGQRHFGRFIVSDVMHRYLTGDRRTEEGLKEIRALNALFKTAISNGDLAAFAEGMRLHAKYLDLLSPLIYNDIIRQVADRCMQFADGCSICGAGGGGYLAALLKEGVSAETLQNALQTEVLPVEMI